MTAIIDPAAVERERRWHRYAPWALKKGFIALGREEILRLCCHCKRYLPMSAKIFKKNRRTSVTGGLSSICNECNTVLVRKRYGHNPQRRLPPFDPNTERFQRYAPGAIARGTLRRNAGAWEFRCSICREFLPSSAFFVYQPNARGLGATCKQCCAERKRRRHRENPKGLGDL